MPVSLTNPPYLFTTQTVYFRGRRIERLVQVYGEPGEIGRVIPENLKNPITRNRHLPYLGKL